MKSVPLTAYPRSLTRRAGLKKVRAASRVPAIVYGRHNPPQNLELSRTDIDNLIHHSVSENVLVDLLVENDTRPKRLVLVQEVQHHALSGQVLHVDLHEVAENEKVSIMVPVETTGEAVGVKTGGGVLEHVLFKIKVSALPKDLPEMLQVDVSNLQVGESIHIGDLKAPEGVEILGDKHISVIAVAAPLTEAQEVAATEAAATTGQVEMIKEKKDETSPAAGKTTPAAGKAEKAPEKAPEKGAEKKAEKKK